MAIDELHQLFLQSCMSRRAFSEKTGQVVYKHCWQATKDQGASEDDAPSYADTVDEINTSIEPFGFQLKRFVDEYSGKPWTAFVNTKSDDLAKVATEYTPQEIAYFRTLIKLIMKSGDRYAISSNDAKSAGRNKTVRPELKLSEAEKVLRTFVGKGWLIATSVKVASKKVDMYQLSTRARMELEHYLSEEYPNQMNKDFECKVCNEMVMKGVQCPQDDCIMRMHDHCARSYFSRNRHICPSCKSPWVAEEAAPIGPEAREGAGRIVSSGSEPDEDGEENGNEAGGSGSEAPAPAGTSQSTQSKAKKTSKGKGKAIAATQDGSDEEMEHDQEEEEEEDEAPRAPGPSSSRKSATKQKDLLAEESEEEKNVPGATQQDDDEEDEEGQDPLAQDEDDDDDDFAARRLAAAAKKKKRKAATQSGRKSVNST